MRKLFTLALIAMLALGLSVSLMSCGAQQEAPPAEETPAETPPMETMMPDTTAADTMTAH